MLSRYLIHKRLQACASQSSFKCGSWAARHGTVHKCLQACASHSSFKPGYLSLRKCSPKLYGYLSSVDKLITSARRHASPLAHLRVAQLLQMRRLGSQIPWLVYSYSHRKIRPVIRQVLFFYVGRYIPSRESGCPAAFCCILFFPLPKIHDLWYHCLSAVRHCLLRLT